MICGTRFKVPEDKIRDVLGGLDGGETATVTYDSSINGYLVVFAIETRFDEHTEPTDQEIELAEPETAPRWVGNYDLDETLLDCFKQALASHVTEEVVVTTGESPNSDCVYVQCSDEVWPTVHGIFLGCQFAIQDR